MNMATGNKKWIVILIAAVVLIGVIAALIFLLPLSPKKVVGVWHSTESNYLSNYDCDTVRVVVIHSNHTSMAVLMDAETGAVLNTEYGEWHTVNRGVRVDLPETESSITYKYRGGMLENGIWTYEKVE